jgi:pimeloyl-ACP methyl ester carboxylesterase
VDDVPFALQAGDALVAIALLREHVADAPIGLWAYSQGTWPATLAAATHPDEIAFLALVSAQSDKPGRADAVRHTRAGAASRLRRSSPDGRRRGVVRFRVVPARRAIARRRADGDRSVRRPAVVPLLTMPAELPQDATWHDIDFDPRPHIERVRCPVHLFYGAEDEWTPVEPSIRAWRDGTERSGAPLTVTELPGLGHAPVDHSDDSVAPAYETALLDWLRTVVPAD